MRLKKLGAALFVAAALAAVLASSAFAAAETTVVTGGGMAQWYTGASPGTLLTGSLAVTATQSSTGTFETTVSGEKIVVHATGVNCVSCSISNTGSVASGSGELEFTGVTVEKPVNCTTTATIKTNPLSVTADWMIGTADYIKFVPTAGETAGFASFSLTGASCPLKTTIIPKGSVFVQSANATGTQASEQPATSSAAINSTAGGSLHVGTEVASLATTAVFKAGGTLFGTH